MPEPLIFAHPAIATAYLVSASPDRVFEWIALSAANKDNTRRENILDQKLILELFKRGEPLINLAIAYFCDDADALAALWKSGDRTTRLAIAANVYRKGFAGLQNVDFQELCAGDDHEIKRLVFENPSMAPEGLANFFERVGNFERLSEEAWLTGVYFAIRNPILRRAPEEDRFADDGWDDHRQRRPFRAGWRLLLVLESNDANASVLSDAFLNFAEFIPPYDDPAFGAQFADEGKTDFSPAGLADFSRNHEQGTRAFVEAMFSKWKDSPRSKENTEGGKWPTDYAFIREGIARGAAKVSYFKDLHRFLRDHPEKWVRAGFYMGFPFSDAASVQAAYQKDGSFFAEEGVLNDSLYRDTPAGRAFRTIATRASGREWRQFSDDQMRRSVFYHRGLRLWKDHPNVYPHPEDDSDALCLEPPKREKDEAITDYLWRRSGEMRPRTAARLEQIQRWLADAPDKPERIVPLLTSLITDSQRELEDRITILAGDQSSNKTGLGAIFGDRRR
jgi:hypothetical protein